MMIFEYSVYLSDIKPKGFYYASLGHQTYVDDIGLSHVNSATIDSCINTLESYLFNSKHRLMITERNFELGKKYYSELTLKNLLREIFQF